MLTAEENERLTRVGPGTPMGNLLRRYWHPVAGLAEMDDRWTKRVRILGEDLVLYKDRSGGFGLIGEACPHRRASLAYGIPTDGRDPLPVPRLEVRRHRALPRAAERTRGRTFKDKVALAGYPIEELGGLLVGVPRPARRRRSLPRYDGFVDGPAIRHVGAGRRSRATGCRSWRTRSTPCTPSGCTASSTSSCASKRQRQGRDRQASREDRLRRVSVRDHQAPPDGGPDRGRRRLEGRSPARVPEHARRRQRRRSVEAVHLPDPRPDRRHATRSTGGTTRSSRPQGADVPPHLLDRVPVFDVPYLDEHGEYMLEYIHAQDIMAWITQGPIADRTLEALNSTDRGRHALSQDAAARDGEGRGRRRSDRRRCATRQQNERIELPLETNKDMFNDGFEPLLQTPHVALLADRRGDSRGVPARAQRRTRCTLTRSEEPPHVDARKRTSCSPASDRGRRWATCCAATGIRSRPSPRWTTAGPSASACSAKISCSSRIAAAASA